MNMTPPKGPPEIPVEIFERIIEFVLGLDEDRLDTLLNCSNVCRSWNGVTLRHIFQHALISPGESCQQFCDLMDANPLIGDVVRELIFHEPDLDENNPNNVPWILQATEMLVGRLPNVTAVMFVGMHESGEIATAELFFNLSTFTKVTRVEMIGCMAPFPLLFAYISSFPNVEKLNLGGVAEPPDHPNRFTLELDYPRPALKAARLRNIPVDAGKVLEWLGDSPSKDSLERLWLSIHDWEPDTAEVFLHKVGPVLREFDVKIVEGGEKDPEGDFIPINVKECTNVKVLTLRTGISAGTPRILDSLGSSELEWLRFSVPEMDDKHNEAYKRLGEELCGVKFPGCFKGVVFICKGPEKKMEGVRTTLGGIFKEFEKKYSISYIHTNDLERFWFTMS